MIEDWDLYAKKLGYTDDREMLDDLYTNQMYSIAQLAQRLTVAPYSVQRKLEIYNIPRRQRGGANNVAEQTRKLYRLDQRIVLTAPNMILSIATDISKSLCYKYRKSVLGDHNGILYSQSDGGPTTLQQFEQASSTSSSDSERRLQEFLRSEESTG